MRHPIGSPCKHLKHSPAAIYFHSGKVSLLVPPPPVIHPKVGDFALPWRQFAVISGHQAITSPLSLFASCRPPQRPPRLLAAVPVDLRGAALQNQGARLRNVSAKVCLFSQRSVCLHFRVDICSLGSSVAILASAPMRYGKVSDVSVIYHFPSTARSWVEVTRPRCRR